MQFLIPDVSIVPMTLESLMTLVFQVPRELKTQMQREQLLAKEAKYQNGVVKAQEYEDLLSAIRDNSNHKVAKGNQKPTFSLHDAISKYFAGIGRTTWGRRISRISSISDARSEPPDKKLNPMSEVWEIT